MRFKAIAFATLIAAASLGGGGAVSAAPVTGQAAGIEDGAGLVQPARYYRRGFYRRRFVGRRFYRRRFYRPFAFRRRFYRPFHHRRFYRRRFY